MGRPSSWLEDRFQPRRVVVVVDAMVELTFGALRYALENFVRPEDNLSLLGILHPFGCPVGHEKKGGGPKLDRKVKNLPTEAMGNKKAELWQKSITDKEIYKLVVSKKVVFDIHVATGPDRKVAMAKQAVNLRASWIILDLDLKEDKEYFMEQLNCNVVLMTSKCEATVIKVELPRAEHPNVLEWKKRWATAVKTARALRYLHEECGVGCIVHCDAHNLPVTYDVVPLVGVNIAHDFPTSQPSDNNATEPSCLGMCGYLAPEYAGCGSITNKADVYSFGVLVLQLITGRKAIDNERSDGENILTEWVRPLIEAGKNLDIVDSRLRNFCDVDQATKMVDVAARCICIDPSQRPSMSEVMGILEHDKNLDSSISTGRSANDISDPSTKCPLETDLTTIKASLMTLQGSALDSDHVKGKGVASSRTAPLSRSNFPGHARPPEVVAVNKMTGIKRGSSLKERVPSLKGKSSRTNSRSKSFNESRHKLSYSEML